MSAPLEHLRREHHELSCLAERELADGFWTWAEQHQAEAAEVLAKIERLEAGLVDA